MAQNLDSYKFLYRFRLRAVNSALPAIVLEGAYWICEYVNQAITAQFIPDTRDPDVFYVVCEPEKDLVLSDITVLVLTGTHGETYLFTADTTFRWDDRIEYPMLLERSSDDEERTLVPSLHRPQNNTKLLQRVHNAVFVLNHIDETVYNGKVAAVLCAVQCALAHLDDVVEDPRKIYDEIGYCFMHQMLCDGFVGKELVRLPHLGSVYPLLDALWAYERRRLLDPKQPVHKDPRLLISELRNRKTVAALRDDGNVIWTEHEPDCLSDAHRDELGRIETVLVKDTRDIYTRYPRVIYASVFERFNRSPHEAHDPHRDIFRWTHYHRVEPYHLNKIFVETTVVPLLAVKLLIANHLTRTSTLEKYIFDAVNHHVDLVG